MTHSAPLRGTLGAVTLAVAAGVAPAAQEPSPSVQVEPPRAFGWQLGDVFERHVVVDLPPGVEVDEASLPKVGRPGGAIELRAIERRREPIAGGERLHLVLRYQLFISPEQPRIYDLRGFRLRFVGSAQTALVEATPIAAAPLMPARVSVRDGLGELRPDSAPTQAASDGHRRRLAWWAALAAAALAWLTHVYLGDRWWAARRRPFARAYRELARRGVPAGRDAVQIAFRRLHRAFDEAAGRALFADGVAGFAAAGSRFAPLRGDIVAFFERSGAAFFDGAATSDDDGRRLLALARALRDVERGAA